MSQIITEGTVKIAKEDDTFFNPAQKLNRDISAEVIKACFKDKSKIRILGAMSATGLREIRYLNEIPNSQLFINDISTAAVETIKNNLELNGYSKYQLIKDDEDLRSLNKEFDLTESNRVNITLSDCSLLMNKYHGYFDVIDIDPFGSCAPFVNDACKAIKHDGLICFTCTDKAALCANEKKCFIRYNTHIKRIYSKNETPIRTLLSYISREFAKFGARIEPVISLSVDFYIRVIVRVKKNKERLVLEDNSYALICNCLNYRLQDFGSILQPICDVCGANMKLYGPF